MAALVVLTAVRPGLFHTPKKDQLPKLPEGGASAPLFAAKSPGELRPRTRVIFR